MTVAMRLRVTRSLAADRTTSKPRRPHADWVEKFVLLLAVAYTHFWVIEGAIRKWVPGLDSVLYIARDAILVLGLIFLGLSTARAARSAWALWFAAFGLLILASAHIVAGLVPLPVGVLGMRSYVAPMLLVYLLWRYKSVGAWRKVCGVVAAYVPVEAALTLVQVISPPNSWVNLQTAGEAASFVNAGVVRASGSFTAPAGLSLYVPLALAACLVVAQSKTRPWAGYGGALLVVTIALLGGSRNSLIAALIVLTAYVFLQFARGYRGWGASAGILILIGSAVIIVVSSVPVVLQSFLTRFEDASRSENSLERVLNQMLGFMARSPSLLGEGIGANSQAGISSGSGAEWIETETVRWVAELGVIGVVLGLARLLGLVVLLGFLVSGRVRGDVITWMLCAALIPVIAYGQITQTPTSQGFVGLAIGCVVSRVDYLNSRRKAEIPGSGRTSR